MTRSTFLGLGISILLLAACGTDKPVGPVAGELTLNLVSPGSADGAILVRVTGDVESVTGLGGYVVEAAEVPGGMWRIVVAGTIVPGPIARIRVPDINNSAPYLAIVEQVAARGTFALLSTGGYSVQVVK